MHIAHFTNTYHPVTSGVVRSVSSFRQALTALGHNVFIFAQTDRAYEDTEPFVFRYPAVQLPLQEYPLTIPVSNFVDTLLPSLKLDVIHAHHPALLGQVAAKKANALDVPLVFTHHTRYREYSHYAFALPQGLAKQVIERWIGDYMSHCQHVVVPSESIKEILTETYGVTQGISVLPTGIDVAQYQKAEAGNIRQQRGWAEDDTILISVGRLAKEKNFETLITAVAPVIQKHPHVRLVILGEGEERAGLEALAEELGVAERVNLIGTIPFDEVPNYLKAADIFCFASVTETQGLVTLEAMATGLPVVAVDATGTRDAVHDGQEGLLTPNEPEPLTAALEKMIEDAEMRQKMAETAVHKAYEFDIQKLAKRLVQVYEEAIEARKAGFHIHTDVQKPIFSLDWRQLLDVDTGS
ncbi:MAG: glycosyltransferase family 4 protein [Ardenticatenaceae bacterium]|nr:glycosyltransferase family 4 protein [Ardenticatenaceae bacterium]